MSSSRAARAAAAALGAALLLVLGCAHAPRSGPASQPAAAAEPRPAATAAPADASPAGTPAPDAARPAPTAPPTGAPARLDPSEEITPAELATIPDPVAGSGGPGGSTGGPGGPGSSSRDTTAAPLEAPPESTAAGGKGDGPAGGEGHAPAPSETVWSVQIYASEDLKEAETVARRAAAALRSEAFVTSEPPLHKVRVGRFATEQEAQALRDRAVRAGFAGAFRIRIGPG